MAYYKKYPVLPVLMSTWNINGATKNTISLPCGLIQITQANKVSGNAEGLISNIGSHYLFYLWNVSECFVGMA